MAGLICQTIARNGRSVRSAPKRSLNVRGLGMDRGSLIGPSATVYAIPGILTAEFRRAGIGSSKARG